LINRKNRLSIHNGDHCSTHLAVAEAKPLLGGEAHTVRSSKAAGLWEVFLPPARPLPSATEDKGREDQGLFLLNNLK
jgi:hypothetical protein